MKVKSESDVAQSCLTLSDPMDCSPPGSSVQGIFQARVLEWGAIAFSIIEMYPFQYPNYDSCCVLRQRNVLAYKKYTLKCSEMMNYWVALDSKQFH